MHEYSLIKKEVENLLSRLDGRRVNRVNFLLGKLTHCTQDSIRGAFELAVANTKLANANLKIILVDPRVKCSHCGLEFGIDTELNLFCPNCGSDSNELISGKECFIKDIEIE